MALTGIEFHFAFRVSILGGEQSWSIRGEMILAILRSSCFVRLIHYWTIQEKRILQRRKITKVTDSPLCHYTQLILILYESK